ncbi:alpha/beta hydrolase [Kribbella sp. NPDC048915]|uniref:alpha/beta hydrolase n=1 Tax=Kribbella sp. NPDC048915 TaxID=3155148 RepID=UPI0033BFBA31
MTLLRRTPRSAAAVFTGAVLLGVADPATGYTWARSVERQLGRYGVLLTYQGWGHGSYGKSPCMQRTIDNYLIARDVARRGSNCPAVPPAA